MAKPDSKRDKTAVAKAPPHSGPHDIGTHVEDAPPTLGTDFGGPGSPTNRLWKNAEDEHPSERRRSEPTVDLPMPADNPGGPPPRRDDAE